MKKLKKFLKDLLSLMAISMTIFFIIISNPRQTISVSDEESAAQLVDPNSKEVQVNFRCSSDKQFADYLSKFMQTNKDLGIEKIDSSIENNEFDVTFRVEK
jgi:hypothetical protein